MAKGCLTDQEIYKIECAIYNDDNKALFESLPEGIEDSIDGVVVKELAQDQEYYIVPDTNMMLRKDGRLLNVKFIRTLKPFWTPRDIIINAKGKQIRYSEVYKSKGWEFNQEEICKRYVNNKWLITISIGYREVYKELYG